MKTLLGPSALSGAAALLASFALVACGGSTHGASGDGGVADGGHSGPRLDGGSGVPEGDEGGPPPSSLDGGAEFDALPPPPQVINADGGVLSKPVIVAVFFSNEDQNLLPSFEQFYTGLGTSTYWQAASEYGVGAATATNVVLTETAPVTVDDTPDQQGDNTALENWLLAEIKSGALPATTPNTTYMINYPTGTTVNANGTSCTDFDGYHSDTADDDNHLISYGVIPRCTDMGSSLTDTFTGTVSHEAIEAATDPYPDYQPGWSQADDAHLFFDEANDGSEIADMCENDPEAEYTFSDFPFVVQRFWSNAAALAGHDPCVPAIPGTTFFNAVPELPDTGPFDYYENTVEVSSVHIPVGGSATVYIDVYSDGPLADWDVNVVDYDYAFGQAMTPAAGLLLIDQPVTTGNNGSRIPVTIKVQTPGNINTNNQANNTELFLIVASQGTSQTAPAHYWYGIVTN